MAHATPADRPDHWSTGSHQDDGHAAPTLIGSVQRALRLLEAAAVHESGAPAKQLAREAGVALPTAYHLLRTLTHERYLRRVDGVYVLGPAVGRLDEAHAQQSRRHLIDDVLRHWHERLGAPVYFALYRDGEVDLVATADTPGNPAVAEWADFRETAHAHAIGQCLLSQLDEEGRRDHLSRHPVRPLTPYSVPDSQRLLRRLAAAERMQPVVEYQQYALGVACAAVPITVGSSAAVLAVSLPAAQAERLRGTTQLLHRDVGSILRRLRFSISI